MPIPLVASATRPSISLLSLRCSDLILPLFLMSSILLSYTNATGLVGSNVDIIRYPCAFIDTVNISGSYPPTTTTTTTTTMANNQTTFAKFPKEFIHNGIVVPTNQVAIYDFIIYNGQRLPVASHYRACICKTTPCIRFCCHPGFYYDLSNRTCQEFIGNSNANANANETTTANNAQHDDVTKGISDQRFMQVTLQNGSKTIVDTHATYMVHVGVPCDRMRLIMKDNHIVHWNLYTNGTIAHRNHLFSKHYCYTLYASHSYIDAGGKQQGGIQQWEWQPLACAPEKLPFVLGVKEWTYAICLIIAVICMFIVLFIYLLSTEMRNTFYGVAIKSYTICVIIGYSLQAHLTLNNPENMPKKACSNIACCIVLFLLLSYMLLSFISFNFYLNFHGIILTKLMFWLIFCPIVLLAVGWAMFARFNYHGGKPVFGYDTCWFDPRNLTIMTYFYAPIFTACFFCLLFYVLSLVRISERSLGDMNKVGSFIEENRFSSFWKFFAYTFATWFIGLISFAVNYYHGELTHINYAVCLFVALHGFGALYALVGKNQQIQNFLRRIEDEEGDEDININSGESCVPMSSF